MLTKKFKAACVAALETIRPGIVDRVKKTGTNNLAAFATKAERVAATCVHFLATGKLPDDTITAFRSGKYQDPDLPKQDWTDADVHEIGRVYDASYFAARLTLDHMAVGPQFGRVGDAFSVGSFLVAWFDQVTPLFRTLWRDGYLSNFSASFAPDLNGRGQYLEEISVLGAQRPRVLELLRAEFGAGAVPEDDADLPVVRTPHPARIQFAINTDLANFSGSDGYIKPGKEDSTLNKDQFLKHCTDVLKLTVEQAGELWAKSQAGDAPETDAAPAVTPPAATPPATPAATVETGRINTDAATDATPAPEPEAASTFSAPQLMAAYIAQGKRIEALEADKRANTFSALAERLITAGKLGPALKDKFLALCEQASGLRTQVSQFAAPGATAPADLVSEFVALLEGNTPVPFAGLPAAVPGAVSQFSAPGASQFSARQAAKAAKYDAHADYYADMKVTREDFIQYGPDVI